jgi:hypothetical protein
MRSGAGDDGTLDQVVELRVHGVSGTKPESMLGDPNPAQVAGDEAARIFRRTTPVVEATYGRSRIVEAFHWGRLTSGSATRALWLLLVPFALLNLARFTMLLPHQQSDVRRRDQAATAVLRLLGLGLTLLLVATACFVGWTVGAPRFDWYPAGGGYFVLLGAVAPAAIVALVWWFGRQVFTHDPAGGMVRGARRTARSTTSDSGADRRTRPACALRTWSPRSACSACSRSRPWRRSTPTLQWPRRSRGRCSWR